MKIQKDSPKQKRVSAITLCDGWFSVKHSYILLKNTVQKLRNKYHSHITVFVQNSWIYN